MHVVDNRIVTQTLYAFLHLQVLIDNYLESAFHFFGIDLILLSKQLFFRYINNVWHL